MTFILPYSTLKRLSLGPEYSSWENFDHICEYARTEKQMRITQSFKAQGNRIWKTFWETGIDLRTGNRIEHKLMHIADIPRHAMRRRKKGRFEEFLWSPEKFGCDKLPYSLIIVQWVPEIKQTVSRKKTAWRSLKCSINFSKFYSTRSLFQHKVTLP